MRRLLLALLLLPLGARADMYPDASNRVMPDTARNLGLVVSVKDYGAIGDGASHPLSTRYGTLAEAQALCPSATALTQEIDWCAAQAAIAYGASLPPVPGYLDNTERGIEIYWPPGYYRHGTSTMKADGLSVYLRGSGPKISVIEYTGSDGVNLLDFGYNSHRAVLSATVGAGGSGYAVGNVLTCAGGLNVATPCQVTVTTVSAGAVTGFTVTQPGDYGKPPNSPVAVTGGSGSGFTLKAENWTRGGTLRVDNMSWINAGQGGIAINAYFNVSTPSLAVEHMEIGKKDTGYFIQGINCHGCSYAIVKDNQAFGAQPYSTDFYYGEDSNSSIGHYSNKFLNNYSHSFINGYHVVNNSVPGQQGLRWQWNDHVRGQRFLYIESLVGSPPEYTVIDNEAALDGYFLEAVGGGVQDLKVLSNEVFIGSGFQVPPVLEGGGVNLRGGLGTLVSGLTINITGSAVPIVNLLTTPTTHGTAIGNFIRNSAGVTAYGVVLEPGSGWWQERRTDNIAATAAVVNNGSGTNDTSLSPQLTAPVVTGGMTVSGNLILNHLLKRSLTNTGTATGTTAADCYQILQYDHLIFSTVPPGSGTCLPGYQSTTTTITNIGANPLKVYPAAGTSINGLGAAAPVTVPVGATWTFVHYAIQVVGTDVNQGGKFSGPINTPKTNVVPVAGGTTALNCGTTIMLNPGTIGTHTVTMPATPPAAGCTVSLATAFPITALTMTDPAARPLYAPLTTLTGAGPASWTFAGGGWVRCTACQ